MGLSENQERDFRKDQRPVTDPSSTLEFGSVTDVVKEIGHFSKTTGLPKWLIFQMPAGVAPHSREDLLQFFGQLNSVLSLDNGNGLFSDFRPLEAGYAGADRTVVAFRQYHQQVPWFRSSLSMVATHSAAGEPTTVVLSGEWIPPATTAIPTTPQLSLEQALETLSSYLYSKFHIKTSGEFTEQPPSELPSAYVNARWFTYPAVVGEVRQVIAWPILFFEANGSYVCWDCEVRLTDGTRLELLVRADAFPPQSTLLDDLVVFTDKLSQNCKMSIIVDCDTTKATDTQAPLPGIFYPRSLQPPAAPARVWMDATNSSQGDLCNASPGDDYASLNAVLATLSQGVLSFSADTLNPNFPVTNAWALACTFAEVFEQLGFNEERHYLRARVNDPLSIVVYATKGDTFINISPKGGGAKVYLRRFRNASYNTALDYQLIAHEYTHAVTSRLANPNELSVFGTANSEALSEGLSDFFALTFYEEAFTQQRHFGLANNGIERNYIGFTYTIDNIPRPLYEPHLAGQVLCAALLDIYDQRQLFQCTAPDIWKLVLNAMHGIDVNPNWILFRTRLLLEATNLPQSVAAITEIWRAFAQRGLGDGAYMSDTNLADHRSSYVAP